jgi:hypothetical protein
MEDRFFRLGEGVIFLGLLSLSLTSDTQRPLGNCELSAEA